MFDFDGKIHNATLKFGAEPRIFIPTAGRRKTSDYLCCVNILKQTGSLIQWIRMGSMHRILCEKSYWQNCQQQTTDGNTKPTSAKRIIFIYLFQIVVMEHFIR
jgi:hypothetical protein